MSALKAELKDVVELALAFSDQADAYRISWNGILLHGSPGTGKTYIAKATAGEFGLNFLHVAAGDMVSAYRGESARNVEAVFDLGAAQHPRPALLRRVRLDRPPAGRQPGPGSPPNRQPTAPVARRESRRHAS